MAEIIKEEQKKLEVKEEIVSIQEEILPSPTVEDTCTVHKQEDDAQMEYTEIKGEHLKNYNLCNLPVLC